MFLSSRRGAVLCLLLAAAVAAANLHLADVVRERGGRGAEREEGTRPDSPMEWARWRESFLQDENGVVPLDGLLRAKAHMDAMRAAQPDGIAIAGIGPGTWTNLGPGNIGGRIRAIVIDPDAPDTMFIGSVSGGIWKTTNGGASWSVVNDFMANLAVTSIVMDPMSPAGNRTYYAGTGEGFFNVDNIRGLGVFKSTDNGVTWTQLASTNNSNFHFVNKLAISSTGVLLAATRAGVYRSADGGPTFPAATGIVAGNSDLAAGMTDVEFNPVDPLLAVASSFGGSAWYSTNGGATWTKATGLPGGGANGFTRVELAMAPNAPATVYASVDSNDGLSPGTYDGGSIYRSVDGGQSYTVLINGTVDANNPLSGQGWYDNALWVNPTNSSDVIWGGIDLWRSSDIGVAAIAKISRWQDTRVSGTTTAATSAHADHHIVVAHPGFNGTSNRTVFFGNDGGIYKASDLDAIVCADVFQGCQTGWTELNNGLAITQFYGAAGHPGTGRIAGGTQDNGSPFLNPATASASENWLDTFGGDGGWSAYDPTDQNLFYGEYIYLQIHRNTGVPGPFSSSYIASAGSNGLLDSGNPNNAEFIAPFILDPSNANTLLAGGSSLWRTTNAKASPPTFAAIKNAEATGTTAGKHISAIAVAPSNPDHIWIGLRDGRVFRTTSGTAVAATVLGSWTTIDDNVTPATNPFPARRITRITVHPTDPDTVFVAIGGFATNNIYKTVNSGTSWTDFTGGATGAPNSLPDVPVRDVEFHPTVANRVYAATEVGVFASEDGGATWKVSPSHDGPSNVSVDELFFLNTDLYAATHGRGIFKTATNNSATGPSFVGGIPNITTPAGVAGSSNFTAADPDNLDSVFFTASSSNTSVVPNANIVFSGSGANRTVTVTPSAGATGSATITVTASDGVDTASTTFAVTIPSLAPTISAIGAQTVVAGASVTVAFIIGDADTPNASLALTAGSSNTTVIPNSSLTFMGVGTNRRVVVNAPAAATGSVTITVTVTDPESNSASSPFALTIQPLPLVGAPQNLQLVGISGNTVTLGWTLGVGQLSPTNHLLEGGINPGEVLASIPTGGASPTFTFVAPTGAFYVRMKTVSGANVSLNSNEIRIFVNVPAPPSAPINLLGMVNGSNLALSWRNTTAGGAPSVIRLNVTGSLAVSVDLPGSAEYFAYAGVPPGSYTFSVTAINATGASTPSNAVTLGFPGACSGAPQMPRNFQATKSGSLITVTWDEPLAGPALTTYLLNVTGSFVGAIPTPTRALAGTVGPGSYTLSVSASNPCGNGPATATQTVVIP